MDAVTPLLSNDKMEIKIFHEMEKNLTRNTEKTGQPKNW